MRIAFIWQGFSGRYGVWRDGLWAAMKHIEKDHVVGYFEPFETEKIHEFNPDWVLYWEAPCTINGKDKDNYMAVCDLPFKKALLFAGGPLKQEWVQWFDHVFVESKINADEAEVQGIPYSIAFGVNEEIFRPIEQEKLFDGMIHATFAGWKRHELFADSLGERGLAVGRVQDHDLNGYNRCVQQKVKILNEVHPELLPVLICSAHTVLNTSEFWGGGQRCTLEAMACNIPPIVMSDSPKNREYVEESGFGIVCEPNPKAIKQAIAKAKETDWGNKGRDYIMSKFTAKHYADAILKHL